NVAHLRSPKVALASGCRVGVFGGANVPGSAEDLDALLARNPDTPPPLRIDADDPSTLLYTSGTTGNPKGVVFTHGRSGTSGPQFIQALRLTPDDTILAVTPLFHGNGWGAVVTALHAGSTVAFPRAFSASEFWPLVHDVGATVLYTLGTI